MKAVGRAQRLSASQISSPSTRKASTILSRSAQRLSASQISSPGFASACSISSCSAQRLSASQISSHPDQNPPDRPAENVLNAFRHHRSHHCARITAMSATASCAQRLSASQISSQKDDPAQFRVFTCSTPFGITDLITDENPFPSPVTGVLNAFRHHRSHHQVTEWLRRNRGDCAQRLSASQISSPRPTKWASILDSTRTISCIFEPSAFLLLLEI